MIEVVMRLLCPNVFSGVVAPETPQATMAIDWVSPPSDINDTTIAVSRYLCEIRNQRTRVLLVRATESVLFRSNVDIQLIGWARRVTQQHCAAAANSESCQLTRVFQSMLNLRRIRVQSSLDRPLETTTRGLRRDEFVLRLLQRSRLQFLAVESIVRQSYPSPFVGVSIELYRLMQIALERIRWCRISGGNMTDLYLASMEHELPRFEMICQLVFVTTPLVATETTACYEVLELLPPLGPVNF